MKRFSLFLLLTTVLGLSFAANAQLLQKAEQIIHTTFSDTPADTLASTDDASRLHEMEMLVQEMKLREIELRSELDAALSTHNAADSIRMADQRMRIDSLREHTAGVPVVVEGDTLFYLYANRGGYCPRDRAAMISENIMKIVKDRSLHADTIHALETDGYTDIMFGDRVILSLTDNDALWQNTTRKELAQTYLPLLDNRIRELREGISLKGILIRAALFILVLVLQYLLFRLTNYLFRKLRVMILRFREQHLHPIFIRDYELLNKEQQGKILIFLSNIVRYIVLFFQLTISVPILFAIFPQTEQLALKIFLYILEPIKMVATSVVEYIPNLFIITVIWLCIRYLIKGLRYISREIEQEKLKINGFYPDWARPTFNIVRFLLYAFMIAMIYPYLPGSDSGVFQGISVFVGLIISLGSSTVIGNIIAGLVITYMRPFKLGDRIRLNDTTGNVIEKTPFVTRLRTTKNEVVTIPNSFIMSSHTVNFSESARQFGLIIHTTVTIGYDAPWRQVHQLLINAARLTPGVLEHPKPFVLETELQDYYPCYQINAYIKEADKYGDIMSALHQNIQDIFNEAGVEIMSPHYYAKRDGSESTIPQEYRNAD